MELGAVGAGGHRHVLVLVCVVSACAVVSGTVSAVPLDWGLLRGKDQSAWRICGLGRRVYRTVLLCGMAGGIAVGNALRGAAKGHLAVIEFSYLSPLTSHLYTEFVARCSDVVADGRHQCDAVADGGGSDGDRDCRDSWKVRVIRESRVFRDCRGDCTGSDDILADRAGGLDICDYQGDTDRVAADLDCRMVSGGTADGVCVAVAAVAVAAGNDGTELLSDSIAVSTVERI